LDGVLISEARAEKAAPLMMGDGLFRPLSNSLLKNPLSGSFGRFWPAPLRRSTHILSSRMLVSRRFGSAQNRLKIPPSGVFQQTANSFGETYFVVKDGSVQP